MSYLTGKKIGFIGGGQMAEAILSGILRAGLVETHDVLVSDISSDRLAQVRQKYSVDTVLNDASNKGAVKLVQRCDVIILAVKPQYLRPVLDETSRHYAAEKHLVISIVGGVPLRLLETYIKAPVIRTMPNTPMQVQEGVAGISLGTNCTEEHGKLAQEVFDAVGISYILPESLIDPLTSVSGCGPAYAYMFIDAMADGGVKLGLPRDMAIRLAAQSLLGSAKMVMEGDHPGKLKDNVCSPGGSTIAGVHALERGGFRAAIIDAVEAGNNRSIEVGKNI